MREYYYQIKGMSADGTWQWPPLASGKVSADDSKKAREILEEEYQHTLPMGRVKKGPPQIFLLHLEDMTHKPYLAERFHEKECKQCGKVYTLNDKYLLNIGGAREFCSDQCVVAYRNMQAIEYDVNFDFNGIHAPVIYKITNKVNGKSYIGKTTQAFTLRWYQHFYQGKGTKFHIAIQEFGITNWLFEVIETIVIPDGTLGKDRHKIILERETYWMNHYDTVSNGYNTVISLQDVIDQEKAEESIIKIPFDGNTL